jgi:hypothetical protein
MLPSLLKFLLPCPSPTNCPSKYCHALPKRKDSTIKEAPMMLILTIFLLATAGTVFVEEIAKKGPSTGKNYLSGKPNTGNGSRASSNELRKDPV